MLKLTASYSKKVPVQGTEFSSQSFHAAVEVEIPDGLTKPQLDMRIHDTFELVKGSVEKELNGHGHTRKAAGRRNNKPEAPASDKQLAYLRDIAVQRGMSLAELDDQAHDLFGIGTVKQLTRPQASRLIDTLSETGSTRRKAA